MNGLGSILGRGLLVLALSGFAVACGDDDGHDHPGDGGAGSGGSGGDGGPEAGSGGAGSGGSGGSVSVDDCVEATEDNTGDMIAAECAMCACEEDAELVSECNAACWTLIACFSSGPCADVDPGDQTAAAACIMANCPEGLSGVANAGDVGDILSGACADECVTGGEPDGGADAGN